MARNQVRKQQERKASKMKSVKTHSFTGFSDIMFGGVVKESINGFTFVLDCNSGRMSHGMSVDY